jgi:hyperosmotically inducible protein
MSPTAPAVSAPTPVDSNAQSADESQPVKSKPSNRADRQAAKARSGGDVGTRVASVSSSNASPEPTPAPSSTDSASAPVGAIADAQQTPAQTGQEAATGAGPATSMEPTASDSQITASVKSEIATAAPNGAVDVTTTNGVVALAGSVSSQDAADQTRQAAQRVPGVKHVDASALLVSNQ